jgi:hypothetical protein
VSDPRYQRRTGAYHIGLSGACLLALAGLAWCGALNAGSAVGLALTAITNAFIGREKFSLLRRGES